MNTQSDYELSSSYVDDDLNAVKSSSRAEEVNRHKNLKESKEEEER